MARIGIIVSYPERYLLAKSIALEDSDIIVSSGTGNEAVGVAKELVKRGAEVIITGARTAYYIQKELKSIPVESIELSSYDIAEAILRSKKFDKNIALITFDRSFSENCENIDFSTLFGCNLEIFYPEVDEKSVEETILYAISRGYKIIMGGKTVNQISEKLGVPHVFVVSGKHVLIKSIDHARSILRFKDETLDGLNLISNTIESASVGIIAVNKFNDIKVASKSALKLLDKREEQVIESSLLDLFPEEIVSRLDTEKSIDIEECNLTMSKSQIYIETADIHSIIVVEKILEKTREYRRKRDLYINKGHKAKYNFTDIKGNSSVINDILKIAKRYASVDSTILIEGETGTGKEVFAQSIHNNSSRKRGQFIAVNCAALTESLLESELFGYVGGAFTGACKNGKVGLFEMANGGTIFLDEIAEMSLKTQAKLLRVIQEREIVKIGDDMVIPIDARIIAATNKNIQKMINNAEFRSDLYYRISVLKFKIPPLRERGNDVKILLDEFLHYYSKIFNRKKPSISKECYELILRYKWPGNIRELQNFCERLITAFDEEVILPNMLYSVLDVKPDIDISQLEINEILDVMKRNKFNKTKTAQELGISRTTLWKILKENNVH